MLLSHLLIQWPLCYNIILIQMQFSIVLISAGFLKEFSLTQILFSPYDAFYKRRHIKRLPSNNTNLLRGKSHNYFSCNFINFHLISVYYLIHVLSFINIYCIPSWYNVHAVTTDDT